jgi:glycosyltransferase involved in cell wall biosynthesis
LQQSHTSIEYIVIDGASTDGTLCRLAKYRDQIAVLVSEPDAGISDAWNKGLALATGDIVGLLNAGDEYAPDAVAQAVSALSSGFDMVYGDTELVADDGALLRANRGRFSLWFYSGGFGFYHPSCFATRALYDRVGGFDTRFRYAMDSDWIARATLGGARISHSGVRARMVDGGVSVKSRYLAYGEHLQALHNAGAGAWVLAGSMVMTGLRGLARAAVGRARG